MNQLVVDHRVAHDDAADQFGAEAGDLRDEAEKDFATTARAINRRAKEIGTEADYDERWGER